MTTEINRVFPDQVDATISPECWILDWEDHGLAPRGLDAATIWISSLTVPTLAERIYKERQADLETRSGKLMALFHCAKILNGSGAVTGPVFELAAREAAKLVADLPRQGHAHGRMVVRAWGSRVVCPAARAACAAVVASVRVVAIAATRIAGDHLIRIIHQRHRRPQIPPLLTRPPPR